MNQSHPKRSRSRSLALAIALFSCTATVSGFSASSSRIRTPIQALYAEDSGDNTNVPLFDDYADETTTTTTSGDSKTTIDDASFGESVPLKNSASFGESVPFKVGESVPAKKPETVNTPLSLEPESTTPEQPHEIKTMKQRNIMVAIASVVFAVSSYVWQFTHPITPVQLLATMQSNSAPLTTIGTNGKPTVVDFWAPWCENCKMAAPTLQKLEEEYKDQVNFVMVNGDKPEAWPLIERFGVDAIPHIALISADGDVETALIGPIPKRVLEADLDALLSNANEKSQETNKRQLPFQMLDVFANAPEYRRVKFEQADPGQ